MRLNKLKAGKRLHEVLEIYKEKEVQNPMFDKQAE